MTMSSYHQRLVTAAALIAVTIAVIWLGGWYMFIFALLIACQSLYEFYMLFWNTRNKIISVLIGMTLGALLLLLAFNQKWLWGLGAILAAFWIANLQFLFDYSKQIKATKTASDHHADSATPAKSETAASAADPLAAPTKGKVNYQDNLILLGGLLYIPAMLQFFLFISPLEIVIIIIAAAATDIGGYYAGSLLGGAKIWPSISPKKTVAGSAGGLCLCTAAILIYGLIWGAAPWWAFLILGIILNLAAQLGDFFESALKRRQGIKDSGSILPGHGGLLDRIDSLLLVIPLYMFFSRLLPLF